MTSTPRITVIVSLYQAERFLQTRLENLVAQTIFAQCEILLYDAASPGNEQDLAAEFTRKYHNIRYTRLPERIGIYAAWNLGVMEAQGAYVANANADDLLRPDALEVMADYMDAHPDCDLVYADYFVTHQPARSFVDHMRSGYATRPEFSPEIMRYACFMGPMPLWRRSLHERFGLFDEGMAAAGDYEFWCRCVAGKARFAHIPQFLGLYLHNSEGICNSQPTRVEREAAQVGKRYAQLLPPARNVPSYQDYYAMQKNFGENFFVNICVVTYNRLDYTRQCLESILRRTRFPYRLSVVDNGSKDGTVPFLQEQHSQGVIHNLYLLPENIGVAKAANIAWHAEPGAYATLKLDNDIVVQKDSWLEDMIHVLEHVPNIGILAYNVEPTSYAVSEINGCPVRIKPKANVGGASALIPRGTCEMLGYWNEEFGLYGEEDADYGARVRLAGLLNVYMEDEDALFHLPAGKAATIATDTLAAQDGLEELQDQDYRTWKDNERKRLVDDPHSAFHRNLAGYVGGWMPLYKSGFEGWSYHHPPAHGKTDCALLFPLDAPRPNWLASLRLACEHAHPRFSQMILIVPSEFPEQELAQANSLAGIRIVRVPGPTQRSALLQQGALATVATWCAVVEPGLCPAPGWNQELLSVAISAKTSRVQGTVWNGLHAVAQARPWPWFFVCKTDLLQRQMTAAGFLDFSTSARLLPHIELKN